MGERVDPLPLPRLEGEEGLERSEIAAEGGWVIGNVGQRLMSCSLTSMIGDWT